MRPKRIRLKIPWLFEVEFEALVTKKDQRVAWELYCELSTRVGFVEVHPDEDLLMNCFASWYSFFQIARGHLKSLNIPKKRQKKETKSLDTIILKLLNEHLRPFLRKWFPHFEHFWEHEADKKQNPIDRQKSFPEFKDLTSEVKDLQEKLSEIVATLYVLATE